MTKKELEKENELLKQVICDIRRYICENLTNEYVVNGARFHLMGDVGETAHLMDIMGIVHYDCKDWDMYFFNTDVFKRKYALYINGVCYEYFKTIKEIDYYLFEKNIDADKYHIEVKKV